MRVRVHDADPTRSATLNASDTVLSIPVRQTVLEFGDSTIIHCNEDTCDLIAEIDQGPRANKFYGHDFCSAVTLQFVNNPPEYYALRPGTLACNDF